VYTNDRYTNAAHAEIIGDAGPSAPWLAMVHGMAQDRRVFDAQVNAFRDRFRIVLIDLPGHGLSADLPGPYGQGEMAHAVGAVLDSLGAAGLHYWGTHTGATLGLLLATRNPKQFSSLILEGPVLPGRPLDVVVEALERAGNLASANGVEAARERWFEEGWFDVMRRCPDECRAAEQRAILADFPGRPWRHPGAAVEPIEDALKTLETLVLLYNGEHDLPGFIAVADQLETLLPHVQRVRIPDAGGFPAWEFPDAVNTIAADFLSR
jgi:pimeloyl-ACP methyl ester carboxylesterase